MTQKFKARPAIECGDVLFVGPQPEPYRRCEPTIRGPITHPVRSSIVSRGGETVTPPPIRFVKYRDAIVWGPGVITLPDNTIVDESLANAYLLSEIAGLHRDPISGDFSSSIDTTGIRTAPRGSYILLKQCWDENYGHWLVEGLPRAAAPKDLNLDGCQFIISASSDPMRRVMLDLLAELGIHSDRVVVCGWEPLKFNELIYPVPTTAAPWVTGPHSARVLEAVRDRVLARRGQLWHAPRLFIWRPETSRRRLRNQADVRDLLEARGYATAMPAVMSFEEQVLTFSAATHIVSTLGAECTNLCFAQTNVHLLGLAPETMHDDFYWDMVSHREGAYASLHGPAVT